jgi:integrase/recombinase XerD
MTFPDEPTNPDARVMTSEEKVDAALKDVLDELGSPCSRRAYATDWNRFYEWACGHHIDLLEVTPKVVRDHVVWMRDERKLKRSTVGKAISTIREVYRALVNAEVIAVNPARETKQPRMDHSLKTPVLNEDQMRTLIGSMPTGTWREQRDRLVVLCLFGLGWRRAEVARMRVKDIDGNTMSAVIKGGKTIKVAVPDWLLEEIKHWRASACLFSGPIFPRSDMRGAGWARPISGAIVYEIVTALAKSAGFPKGAVTPHAMRRTNITIAGQMGVSLKARQLAVGHATTSMTERYDHARSATIDAVGNVFSGIVSGKDSE